MPGWRSELSGGTPLTADLNRYHFRSRWTVPAGYQQTYSVLRDLSSYRLWWPEVRSVLPVDGSRAVVLIMGLLPYSLELMMDLQIDDPRAGILRAGLSGDLDGYSSWHVKVTEGGCSLEYEQEVEVQRALLRALAPLARPLFKLNHRLMMKRGQRGLRAYLASSLSREAT